MLCGRHRLLPNLLTFNLCVLKSHTTIHSFFRVFVLIVPASCCAVSYHRSRVLIFALY